MQNATIKTEKGKKDIAEGISVGDISKVGPIEAINAYITTIAAIIKSNCGSTQVQFRWRWNQFAPVGWLLNAFWAAFTRSLPGLAIEGNPYAAAGSLTKELWHRLQ
jgi:hypothetical protein